MAEDIFLTLTADIVSAQAGNNSVAAGDLPGLIAAVYDSLKGLGSPAPVVEEKREPAVSVRASVKPHAIACLECGAKFKMLKRHLHTDHNLTPAEYRVRWGLPATYPVVAPDYAATRRELAVKIGLGRKAAAKAKPAAKTVRKPGASKAPVNA